MTTKISKLTSFNIDALKETLTDDERRGVTLGATVAEFNMSATEAFQMVKDAQTRAGDQFGRRGHPYQSLSAVLRKLRG